MQVMKRINEKEEESLGAVADELNFTLKKGTKANKIRFVFKAVQNGATLPTLSDFLNQLASKIAIKIGNTTIMSFDPVELNEYMIRKLKIQGFAMINDGTGADNHIMIYTFDLPLCPMDKNMIDFMNPEYGFDGSRDINFTITYPADANELDGRLIDVYAIALPDSNAKKVIEYEELTKTFTATGKDQVLSLSQKPAKKIYEVFFKQTSYLSEGLTAFTRTVEKIAYQEDNEDNEFYDIIVEHLNEPKISASEITGALFHDDQYFFLKFYHNEDAETSKQLSNSSQLSVTVGVAEAVTYTQIRIVPLSAYKDVR